MRYILMSNVDGQALGALPPDQHADLFGRFVAFTQALAESGVLRGAEQLEPADTATTLRVRDGEAVLTDGPFADVAESFGGFWVVEAPDLDTALGHARACPGTEVGSVEVRALTELG
ncbi:YciI family protein [Actinomycetospora sp. CA-101289]|uniref:YciI family protein n=1 Tax=Actinomycetospora sp. CA-101289 TaxID=3239893 RepID=UPI003D96DAA6